MHQIREVDTRDPAVARKIHCFNRREPKIFPELHFHHLRGGVWWLAFKKSGEAVGFAGMVPHLPGTGVPIGFLKRAYVTPEARGCWLQRRFIRVRCDRAQVLGWTHLLAESTADNVHSGNNLLACGFDMFEPDQPWGPHGSVYWIKKL